MAESALESAGRGGCNAGRGPREIEPGKELELLRIVGDTAKGRTHVVSVAVYDEDDKPVPTVLAVGTSETVGVPLVGILRFGQDGAMPVNVEIDIGHGTSFTVPGSMIGLSVRNDATPGDTVIGPDTYTEEDKTRKVAAWVNEGTMGRHLVANRTIQNIGVVAPGGGFGPLTRIPKFAVGVVMYVDFGENPADKLIEFFDDFGNQLGQVSAQQAQSGAYAPIPNEASFVRFQNVNFIASERHSFVFSLAF